MFFMMARNEAPNGATGPQPNVGKSRLPTRRGSRQHNARQDGGGWLHGGWLHGGRLPAAGSRRAVVYSPMR